MPLFVITGLALRFPALFDYRARQFTKVVPATGEGEALEVALRELADLAPTHEGWEGHTVRALPLAQLLPLELEVR